MNEAMLNRLLAALADVPAGERPHFGRVARELKITATEVTVGVWQLVNAGRIDRHSLRPPNRQRPRPYCQQPGACEAQATGACRIGCRPAAQPPRPPAPPSKPQLTAAAGQRLGVHDVARVWCDQCNRRVPVSKAVSCQSRWCKAELPPPMRECPL